MHLPRKAAKVAIHAGSTQTAFHRLWERAFMAVDAFEILAMRSTLARGLAGDDAETVLIRIRERDIVAMRALVCFTSSVVAATTADEKLIAQLHFL